MARPSKYNPIFCGWLIDHFANGGEFQTFPGYIYHKTKELKSYKEPLFVSVRTLYDWVNPRHSSYCEEFSHTKESAECLREYYWKVTAISDKDIHPTKWIFCMRNMFGWSNNPNVKANDYVGLETPKLDAWFDGLVQKKAKELIKKNNLSSNAPLT